ncbi:alginate lyase family protein [Vibrio artabrorum]|uniref:Alginate lyase family protein n=1 Tax=Vibrio artabrorum TaxID=446374 RepID=A0ABT8CMD3_9VIBR|nr:alginate lyase family protein [Vibrio artabrorum]MDN3702305.1 alginate lyase family protein [Vibrio artabrorum]
MKTVAYTLTFFACFLSFGQAHAGNSDVKYYGADKGALTITKAKIKSHDKDVSPAYLKLINEADSALKLKCPTVTDKTISAISGDVHDYYSTAPYLWPDPSKPNGLPYMPRDGMINPESRNPLYTDKMRLDQFGKMIDSLSLAYYFSDNTKYAEKAASCLRTWYINPATRMNPNINYGQAVPGLLPGRGIGIIEGKAIISTIDAASLLDSYKEWAQADKTALHKWSTEYFDWLLTSENGQEEANMKQNHGSMYDLQTARLALVLGLNDTAKSILEQVKSKRIALQIEPDGAQPMELRRTKGFQYSLFNLESLSELAQLGQWVNVDLWNYETNDERGILNAIEFMRPYVEIHKDGVPLPVWHYEQIHALTRERAAPLFRMAANVNQDKHYEAIASQFEKFANSRVQLLRPSRIQ